MSHDPDAGRCLCPRCVEASGVDDLHAQLATAVETVGMLERDNADLRAKLAACEKERDIALGRIGDAERRANTSQRSENVVAGWLSTMETRALAAEARNAQLVALLRRVEHVKLPCMRFSRCPVCLSPLDLSQPHEDDCELAAALKGET